MRKSKLLIVTNPQSAATDWYRTVTPYSRLEETTGAIEISTKDPGSLRWYDLDQADIILFSRPNGPQMLGFVAEAAMMGKQVIGDFDDDLFQLSAFNPASKWFDRPDIKATVENTFKWFSWVTVSTPLLKEIYGHFYPLDRITIIPNAYNNHFKAIKAPTPEGKQIQMFWRGSSTHLEDIFTIAPVLNGIIANERFKLTMYGLDRPMLPWLRPGYDLLEWNTLFRYFAYINQTHLDWFIVPLVPNRFNQAKSNIAAVEGFMLSGAACLAPPLDEFKRPGIVNYESPQELAEIVNMIGLGQITKGDYVREGQEWFKAYCSLDQTNIERLAVLDSVRRTEPFFYKTLQPEQDAPTTGPAPNSDASIGKLVQMSRPKSKVLARPGKPKK